MANPASIQRASAASLTTDDPDQGWSLRPPLARWLTYLRLGLLLDLLFVAVYGGTIWLNQGRADYLGLFLDWELRIPLIPGFIYPYLSIFLLFLLPPFALPVPALRRLASHIAVATILGGIAFLLFPTRLGFTPYPTPDQLPVLYRLLVDIDLPYNLCPSLHVTYATLTILAIRPSSPGWAQPLLLVWLGLMCASVVLVHQHHLLDILCGVLLALAIRSAMGKPKARPQQSPTEPSR